MILVDPFQLRMFSGSVPSEQSSRLPASTQLNRKSIPPYVPKSPGMHLRVKKYMWKRHKKTCSKVLYTTHEEWSRDSWPVTTLGAPHCCGWDAEEVCCTRTELPLLWDSHWDLPPPAAARLRWRSCGCTGGTLPHSALLCSPAEPTSIPSPWLTRREDQDRHGHSQSYISPMCCAGLDPPAPRCAASRQKHLEMPRSPEVSQQAGSNGITKQACRLLLRAV